jgi:O-antigen/teichoic acid export membrane protein
MGVLVVRVVGSASALAVGVVLANVLGVRGYGEFELAKGAAVVLATFITFGFSTLLVQRVAAYGHERRWGELKGMLATAYGVGLGLALLVVLVGVGVLWWLGDAITTHVRIAVELGLVLAGLFGVLRITAAALIGRHRVVAGMFFTLAMPPALVLLVVTPFWPAIGAPGASWLGLERLDSASALGIELAAASAAVAFSLATLRRAIGGDLRGSAPVLHVGQWLSEALPMLLLGYGYVAAARIDSIMVGMLMSPSDAGIYYAAAQWGGVTTYPFVAMASTIAPTLSEQYVSGDRAAMQRTVATSMRWTVALVASILLILVVSGEWLLELYGPEFIDGYATLVILAIGQALSVVLGPVWIMLLMTDRAKTVAWAILASLVIDVALNLALVPHVGLVGAAVATTVALVTTRFVGVLIVRKWLSVDPTVRAAIHDR